MNITVHIPNFYDHPVVNPASQLLSKLRQKMESSLKMLLDIITGYTKNATDVDMKIAKMTFDIFYDDYHKQRDEFLELIKKYTDENAPETTIEI